MQTYSRGITLPLMRPVPIPSPVKVDWYDLPGHVKTLKYRTATRNWRIEEDYTMFFPWLQVEVCIPKGFVFDGASVPRPLWSFMAPTGIMFLPGLFHDFGYRYNCFIDKNYKPMFVGAGQKFFDQQIRRLGVYCNEAEAASAVVYYSLRSFGFIAWGENRRNGYQVYTDFPQRF